MPGGRGARRRGRLAIPLRRIADVPASAADGRRTAPFHRGRERLGVGRHRPARGAAVEGRASRSRWLALLCLLPGAAGWCQDNPYVYVKMSLAVPWTLYFVFLGAVLIPFLVMIALAWRGRAEDTPDDDSSSR